MSGVSLHRCKEILDTFPHDTLLILDVRSEREHQTKRIEGSYNIPLAELPHHLDELSGYETVILYCNEGRRSEEAFHLLKILDIPQLFYVAGSSKEWETAGLPVVMMA